MMNCPNCNFSNRSGVKFCENCGTKLTLAMAPAKAQLAPKFCKECGVKLREGIRFCENCGAELKLSDQPAQTPIANPSSTAAPLAPPLQPTVVAKSGESKRIEKTKQTSVKPASKANTTRGEQKKITEPALEDANIQSLEMEASESSAQAEQATVSAQQQPVPQNPGKAKDSKTSSANKPLQQPQSSEALVNKPETPIIEKKPKRGANSKVTTPVPRVKVDAIPYSAEKNVAKLASELGLPPLITLPDIGEMVLIPGARSDEYQSQRAIEPFYIMREPVRFSLWWKFVQAGGYINLLYADDYEPSELYYNDFSTGFFIRALKNTLQDEGGSTPKGIQEQLARPGQGLETLNFLKQCLSRAQVELPPFLNSNGDFKHPWARWGLYWYKAWAMGHYFQSWSHTFIPLHRLEQADPEALFGYWEYPAFCKWLRLNSKVLNHGVEVAFSMPAYDEWRLSGGMRNPEQLYPWGNEHTRHDYQNGMSVFGVTGLCSYDEARSATAGEWIYDDSIRAGGHITGSLGSALLARGSILSFHNGKSDSVPGWEADTRDMDHNPANRPHFMVPGLGMGMARFRLISRAMDALRQIHGGAVPITTTDKKKQPKAADVLFKQEALEAAEQLGLPPVINVPEIGEMIFIPKTAYDPSPCYIARYPVDIKTWWNFVQAGGYQDALYGGDYTTEENPTSRFVPESLKGVWEKSIQRENDAWFKDPIERIENLKRSLNAPLSSNTDIEGILRDIQPWIKKAQNAFAAITDPKTGRLICPWTRWLVYAEQPWADLIYGGTSYYGVVTFDSVLKANPEALFEFWDSPAFLKWLKIQCTKQLGISIEFGLPSEHEWTRAGQGNDHRKYPWGDKKERRNFENGVSPYGVVGMCSYDEGKSVTCREFVFCDNFTVQQMGPRGLGEHATFLLENADSSGWEKDGGPSSQNQKSSFALMHGSIVGRLRLRPVTHSMDAIRTVFGKGKK